MKHKLPTLTIATIREMRPCYNPNRYLPEDWSGNILHILENDAIPAKDRIWVAMHLQCMPIELIVIFAAGCAREACDLAKVDNTDILNAIDLAEQWAFDKSPTAEQLWVANRKCWDFYYANWAEAAAEAAARVAAARVVAAEAAARVVAAEAAARVAAAEAAARVAAAVAAAEAEAARVVVAAAREAAAARVAAVDKECRRQILALVVILTEWEQGIHG